MVCGCAAIKVSACLLLRPLIHPWSAPPYTRLFLLHQTTGRLIQAAPIRLSWFALKEMHYLLFICLLSSLTVCRIMPNRQVTQQTSLAAGFFGSCLYHFAHFKLALNLKPHSYRPPNRTDRNVFLNFHLKKFYFIEGFAVKTLSTHFHLPGDLPPNESQRQFQTRTPNFE